MSKHPFYWVDAFTNTRYGGNPCSVVFDADDITEKQRLIYTKETRLSECAFIQKSDVADFGARYYLPSREIKMAGHPTIATVTALIESGRVTLDQGHADFTLEVGAGIIPIKVSPNDDRTHKITMQQPKPVFGRSYLIRHMEIIGGLDADDIIAPPQTVSVGGSKFAITVLRNHDALRRVILNKQQLIEVSMSGEIDYNEPYFCTLSGATEMGRTFGRLLLPPPEPPEDPFTGSAVGCMAAYLWKKGLIQSPNFIAEQGHWMGRPSHAEVEVLGKSSDITGILVSGTGIVVMQGEVFI